MNLSSSSRVARGGLRGLMVSVGLVGLLLACGTSDANSSTSSGGSSSSGGNAAGGKCVANTKDGQSACNSTTCAPGRWCNTIICEVGCTDTSNCPTGTACDLSNPVEWFGKKVGTCRTCEQENLVVGNQCSDVKGAYNFAVASGSSADCKKLFDAGAQCTFTQTDCKVTANCGGTPLTFDLDNRNRGTAKTTVQGASVTCDFQFYENPKGVTATCQVVAQGGALVCNLSGDQR